MSKLLLIILIQLIYVPLLTLRTITMVKNLKLLTTIFGFLEAFTYVFGLAIVLSGEQNVIEMVVYALGFALGLFVGIFVEQKMAIGFVTLSVNINHPNKVLVDHLRSLGYGVTVFQGEGRDGVRFRLEILTKRRKEKELYRIIDEFEPTAFLISYEPKTFKGGYLSEMMKRRSKQKQGVAAEGKIKPHVMKRGVNEVRRETAEFSKTWKKF
ncbi:DUF2179 domain-containing protein [Gottschalkiaceae bacterium SANA]|nr:DUF2179 domain-containing protein [Gottschalkiaceae bacterium SANA]